MGSVGRLAGGVAGGDVRLYRLASPDKTRPVVVLTRDSAIAYLSTVSVAPIIADSEAHPQGNLLDRLSANAECLAVEETIFLTEDEEIGILPFEGPLVHSRDSTAFVKLRFHTKRLQSHLSNYGGSLLRNTSSELLMTALTKKPLTRRGADPGAAAATRNQSTTIGSEVVGGARGLLRQNRQLARLRQWYGALYFRYPRSLAGNRFRAGLSPSCPHRASHDGQCLREDLRASHRLSRARDPEGIRLTMSGYAGLTLGFRFPTAARLFS